MPIITLTTDWGVKDYYVGVVKGKILAKIPNANIVDISHEIPPFDIFKASFLIKNTYAHFPVTTFHYIGVVKEGKNKTFLMVQYNGHYFFGSDIGLFSLLFDKKPEMILDLSEHLLINNHENIDALIELISYLFTGGDPYRYGKELNSWNTLISLDASYVGNIIKGYVVYIDNFGNLITNITRAKFEEVHGNRSFYVVFGRARYNISEISQTYSDVPDGERLVLFNSAGYLQVSLNKGKAASLLGLRINDVVMVEFY